MFLRLMSNKLLVRSLIVGTLLLGVGSSQSGCANVPDVPPLPPAVSTVASYYMPRSTAIRFKYSHLDYRGASYNDSAYYFAYDGFLSGAQTVDGFNGVDQYSTSDLGMVTKHPIESFVSDSVVVEYGSDYSTTHNRITLLKTGLRDSATWIAADQFITPDGRTVQIKATVLGHLDNLAVGNMSYANVYPISYDISGPPSSDPNSEYQSGGRHVIYFAQNLGKILEACYGSSAQRLWVDQLDTVIAR